MHGGNAMLTDIYEDMDQEYRSRIFLARKQLLGSLESPTLLPAYGLNARGVLNPEQLKKVESIRERKNRNLAGSFTPD